MESYKHQAAKDTLRQWIDDNPALLFRGIMMRFRSEREVLPALMEFPVTHVSVGRNDLGSVTARPFINKDGSIRTPQPSYEELRADGFIVHAILDIGVLNTQRELRFGFEIVHRCPVSPEKAAYLDTMRATTCEISAEWILCQVEPPGSLKINRIFGHNFWDNWYDEQELKIIALGGATPPPGYEYKGIIP